LRSSKVPRLFDRLSRLTTEAVNPRTVRLDRIPITELLELMNDEDRRVPRAIRRVLPRVAHAVELAEKAIAGGGRLFYVGAGTSGRLGVLDATECPPTFGTPPKLVKGIIAGGMRALVRSVEGAEDNVKAGRAAMSRHGVSGRDMVVGIAACRLTPYVGGALEAAVRRGASTALLCSSPEGELGIPVDVIICPVVGPETLMGSTRLKAGTAQKMVLNMISTAVMVRRGKVYRNMMVDLQSRSRKLHERSRRVVMLATGSDYDEADLLLKQARGHVKTAIVMGKRGVSLAEARRLLRDAGGHVYRALGEKD
jgi:N-acetylmuramic acid 6-phosphate etherase